jgi:peptidoglycan hydrolase CwlO-like protein
MNRTEFVVAIAAILFVAFVLGWFAHWLVGRFSRVTHSDMAELENMAKALHDAEEMRDEAIAYVHHREQELQTQLTQTAAELEATMDGLRDARREVAELRAYIEQLNNA